MMKKLLSLIPVLLLTLNACGPSEAPSQHHVAPVAVHTAMAAASEESTVVEAAGSLQSTREALISSKVMGTITEIRKKAGDIAHSGDILIVIDSRDVAGQIQQARGALAQAMAATAISETNFRRFEKLFAKGAASQLELDQARFQYETAKGATSQAEGAVATATSYQSYAEIPAPFDGRIVDRLCDVGEMAAPGRPLVKMEDSRHIRLEVAVTEQNLQTLSVGAPVQVRVPSLDDRAFAGTVSEIVPAADPATHNFLVKIALPEDTRLRAGLYGRALFVSGIRTVIRLPRSAIITHGGMTSVLLVDNKKADRRMVLIADGTGDPVEILSGLSAGDEFVVSPPSDIEDGMPVEVLR